MLSVQPTDHPQKAPNLSRLHALKRLGIGTFGTRSFIHARRRDSRDCGADLSAHSLAASDLSD